MTPRAEKKETSAAEMLTTVRDALLCAHTWETAGIPLDAALRGVLEERARNLAQTLVLRDDHLFGGALYWCPDREDYFPRATDHDCGCGFCVGCTDEHTCESCAAELQATSGYGGT